MDTGNGVVIKGRMGWVEVKRGIGGINGDGGKYKRKYRKKSFKLTIYGEKAQYQLDMSSGIFSLNFR